jgi:hypothetical protein
LLCWETFVGRRAPRRQPTDFACDLQKRKNMPALYRVFVSFIEHAPPTGVSFPTESVPKQSFHEVTLLRRWWRKARGSSVPRDTYMRRDIGLLPLNDRGLPR